MAHKKCCEMNTLVRVLANVCIEIRQSVLFSMMAFVLLCVQVVSSKIKIPSYLSVLDFCFLHLAKKEVKGKTKRRILV